MRRGCTGNLNTTKKKSPKRHSKADNNRWNRPAPHSQDKNELSKKSVRDSSVKRDRSPSQSPELIKPASKRRDLSVKAFPSREEQITMADGIDGEDMKEVKENMKILNDRVNTLYNDYSKSTKSDCEQFKIDITDIKKSLNDQSIEIDLLKKENKTLKGSLEIVQGVLTRKDKEIMELKKEMLDSKIRSMSMNLVFSGIPDEVNEHPRVLRNKMNDFFVNALKIPPPELQQIQVAKMHRARGDARRGIRPVVMKLATDDSKKIILDHTANLKHIPNVYVNEQFPPEVNEKRKGLLKKRKELQAQGVKAKLVVDKLYINGKEWKENIPPTNININNYKEAQRIHVYHAPKISALSSTFQGHVIKLDDPTLYKAALYKLFQDQVVARATHNIWAIKCGNEVAYDDDGEHMAGFKLLEVLRNHNINNILVVVTRWYGGTHLGPQRFKYITDAAMQSLEHAGIIKPQEEGNPAMLLTKTPTLSFRSEIEETATAIVQDLPDTNKINTITGDTLDQQQTQQQQEKPESDLRQRNIFGMEQNSSNEIESTKSGSHPGGLPQTRFQEVVQPSG